MYCPTCLRSTFKKTYIEGLVTVLSFDYATRVESIELVQEDDVFKEWICACCGRELEQESSKKALDDKVEKWVEEHGLCCLIN
jgi:hypothetical protein